MKEEVDFSHNPHKKILIYIMHMKTECSFLQIEKRKRNNDLFSYSAAFLLQVLNYSLTCYFQIYCINFFFHLLVSDVLHEHSRSFYSIYRRYTNHLTLKMTSAQVAEASVNVISNSPSQDYTHPDDRTLLYDMTPGFKPFTILQ